MLGVHFVKLGAAVAATVLSAGTAAGSIVNAVSDASATVTTFVTASKALGGVALAVLDSKEALDGAAGQESALRNAPPRRVWRVPGGSFHFKKARCKAATCAAPWASTSANSTGAPSINCPKSERVADAERLKRMTCVVVQMIRPARSSIEGKTRLIKGKDATSPFQPLGYTAKMEVHRNALVRIGPSKPEIVSGAAKSVETTTATRIENLLRPWDSRIAALLGMRALHGVQRRRRRRVALHRRVRRVHRADPGAVEGERQGFIRRAAIRDCAS